MEKRNFTREEYMEAVKRREKLDRLGKMVLDELGDRYFITCTIGSHPQTIINELFIRLHSLRFLLQDYGDVLANQTEIPTELLQSIYDNVSEWHQQIFSYASQYDFCNLCGEFYFDEESEDDKDGGE